MNAGEVAGKAGHGISNNLPLIIGVIAVVVAIYLYTNASVSPTQVTDTAVTTPPNSALYAAQAQVAQTNAQLDANFQQSVFGAFGQIASLDATQIQTNGALQAAALQTNSQNFSVLQQATVANNQTNAALQAAEYQANAQSQALQAQAHASQQNSFWGGLFGAVGSALPFFSSGSLGSLFGSGSSSTSTGGFDYLPSPGADAPISRTLPGVSLG
jgi:hypothetical protein